jgi:ComF family protein
MRTWPVFLRSPLDALSCALLPASCLLCKAPLLRLTAAPVCSDCWESLRPQDANLCSRCGEDLGIAEFAPSETNPAKPEECRPCSLVPPAFDRAVAFGVYESTLRSLIHMLKYERIESVARKLAATLTRQVVELCSQATGEVLVIPVPLHGSKQRERGFNQSDLLARALVTSVKRQSPALLLTVAAGMLQRKRATESQATLTNVQRRRNLRGAFFVSAKDAAKVSGCEVLLIDDIYTTGATARACSETLKKAGAAKVWVATVARAQRDGVARWDAGSIAVTTPLSFVTEKVREQQHS